MRSSRACYAITFALSEIAFVSDLTTQHDEDPPTRKFRLIFRLWVGPARKKYCSVAPYRVSKFAFSHQPGGGPQLSSRQATSQRDTAPFLFLFGLSFESSDLQEGLVRYAHCVDRTCWILK
jgi:hypothetical protein